MTTDENFLFKLFPMIQVKGYTEMNIQLLLLPANQVLTESLFLNIFSSLGATVLGKITMLFLIEDNLSYLIIRKASS